MKLPVHQIRTDGGTQLRGEINIGLADDYAQAMKAGATLPPIIVFYDGTDYWLADGFHRVQACKLDQIPDIDADVRTGTRRDAILFAVSANDNHGLRRSNEDKRRAVETLLRDEEWAKWSDRKIAEACRVTHPFVARLRAPASGNVTRCEVRKVERNGVTYEQDTSKIGKRAPAEHLVNPATHGPELSATIRKSAGIEYPVDRGPAIKPEPLPIVSDDDVANDGTPWDERKFLFDFRLQLEDAADVWLQHNASSATLISVVRGLADIWEKVDAKKRGSVG